MTKKDEINTSEKEIYRLWWEYLKRSEKYKIYCNYMHEFSKIKIKKGKTNSPTALKKPIKPTLTVDLNILEFNYMQRYFNNFGDIFIDSFDDWWKKFKPSQYKYPVFVLNHHDAIKGLPLFTKEFKKQQKEKRKPLSPKEMLNILTESEYEFIFLAVPMVGGVTMEDISKQIADIRKKWIKKFDIEDFNFRRFYMPVSRVRFGELQRYLKVYDLHKQGHTMKEIIAKIDPHRSPDNDNVLRSYRSDLQKAKKVIYHVEIGSFPEEPRFG